MSKTRSILFVIPRDNYHFKCLVFDDGTLAITYNIYSKIFEWKIEGNTVFIKNEYSHKWDASNDTTFIKKYNYIIDKILLEDK